MSIHVYHKNYEYVYGSKDPHQQTVLNELFMHARSTSITLTMNTRHMFGQFCKVFATISNIKIDLIG